MTIELDKAPDDFLRSFRDSDDETLRKRYNKVRDLEPKEIRYWRQECAAELVRREMADAAPVEPIETAVELEGQRDADPATRTQDAPPAKADDAATRRHTARRRLTPEEATARAGRAARTDAPEQIGTLLDAAEAAAATEDARTGYGIDRMTPKMRRVKRTPLSTFQRDFEQVNTLIQGGWGKRGGISMHVSTTGSGKSVLQTQSALCFHQGIECCGLKPAHPFTMWVIQSEDDDDRVAFDRDCIVERLARMYPDNDWQRALEETRFLDFTGLTGAEFIRTLNNELFDGKPDGVIINPMNAFFGGNLKDGSDASAFFKGGEIRRESTEGLEAVLKRHNVWAWMFAHTPKPPTAKEINGWLNDDFPEYKMCGASEIADAVRSVMTFLKVPGHDGTFAFTAGKNGKGLGWTDPDGVATNRAFYRWTQDGGHFWEQVPDGERPRICGASETKSPKTPPPPPRDEMPILMRTFTTFKTVMPKGAAAQAVRDAVNAERCRVSPPVKPMGRNDSVSLVELAIATGKIECIEYGGTKGTLCALAPVMNEYRDQLLPGMTADKPTARKGKGKGGVA